MDNDPEYITREKLNDELSISLNSIVEGEDKVVEKLQIQIDALKRRIDALEISTQKF